MQYKKIFLVAIASTYLMTAPAFANVGAGMSNWFDSMGGFSNATPPSAYKGQTMNGFSGGGMYLRTPQKNYQLAQMTPPSLNIGCGGIDLTAGSFSFINQKQLTAMFQNIGTSLGYAFLLAIKASMPSIASSIEYLQNVANKVNAMNVNACQLSEGMTFKKGADVTQSVSDAADHMLGNLTNALPDSFGSWSATQAQKDASLQTAAGTDPSIAAKLNPSNVVWKALSHANANGGMDTQDMQFIMSMTGTIITTPPNGSGANAGNPKAAGWTYIEPAIQDVSLLIGYAADAPNPQLPILTCDEPVNCLKPTPSTLAATTFMQLVGTKLDNMRNNVASRSQQNINDLNLVETSSLPVWKMLSLTATVNPGFIENYKRLIAVDLAYQYVTSILRMANSVLSNEVNGASAPTGSKDALDKLQARLDALVQNTYAQRKLEYGKVQQEADLERELQLLNQTMVGGLPAQAYNSIVVFGGTH